MNEIMVGELSEFAEGGYRVLRVDTFEFGVFRQGDRVVAYENYCPHDGGPVCQGKVIPRVEEELGPDQTSRGLRFSDKRNIVCPWHGWEFDIESGRHCGDPKYRLRPVDVRVRDNRVYVSVPARELTSHSFVVASRAERRAVLRLPKHEAYRSRDQIRARSRARRRPFGEQAAHRARRTQRWLITRPRKLVLS